MSFNRLIELTIEGNGISTTITDLRIRFNILKTEQESTNEAEIEVFNVSDSTYDKLAVQDNTVILKAGYEDEGGAKLIFTGTIDTPERIKEGVRNSMLLTCRDGQKETRTIPISISYKNTKVVTVVNDILSKIPLAVARKAVIPDSTYRSYAFIGRAIDGLSEVLSRVGLKYNIQNNEIYILEVNETVEPIAHLISPKTGLIESPNKLSLPKGSDSSPDEKVRYKVRSLLNPSLIPGSYIQLSSKNTDGFFKVANIEQKGDNWDSIFESEMEVHEI